MAGQGLGLGHQPSLRQRRVWPLPRPQGTGTRQEVEIQSCSFPVPPNAHISGQNPGPSGWQAKFTSLPPSP